MLCAQKGWRALSPLTSLSDTLVLRLIAAFGCGGRVPETPRIGNGSINAAIGNSTSPAGGDCVLSSYCFYSLHTGVSIVYNPLAFHTYTSLHGWAWA